MVFEGELSTARVMVRGLAASGCGFAAGSAEAVLRDAAALVRDAQAVLAQVSARAADAGVVRAAGGVGAYLRAREKLSSRTARALSDAMMVMERSPSLSDAVATGAASIDHAAVVRPVLVDIDAGNVDDSVLDGLVPLPFETVYAFSRRVLRALRDRSIDNGESRERRQRRNSRMNTFPAEDNMVGFTAIVDPVRGAVVTAALDATMDELWRAQPRGTQQPRPDDVAGLRADALVEIARRALNGGVADLAGRAVPQMIVHIDHQTLLGDLRAHEVVCELDDGTPISAAMARRLACEANIIPVVLGGASEPLDLGREHRLATEAQRRAMRARSRTCDVEGCDVPWQRCQAHHLDEWDAKNGATDIERLRWACRSKHHTLMHEKGWGYEELPNGKLRLHPPSETDTTAAA